MRPTEDNNNNNNANNNITFNLYSAFPKQFKKKQIMTDNVGWTDSIWVWIRAVWLLTGDTGAMSSIM